MKWEWNITIKTQQFNGTKYTTFRNHSDLFTIIFLTYVSNINRGLLHTTDIFIPTAKYQKIDFRQHFHHYSLHFHFFAPKQPTTIHGKLKIYSFSPWQKWYARFLSQCIPHIAYWSKNLSLSLSFPLTHTQINIYDGNRMASGFNTVALSYTVIMFEFRAMKTFNRLFQTA